LKPNIIINLNKKGKDYVSYEWEVPAATKEQNFDFRFLTSGIWCHVAIQNSTSILKDGIATSSRSKVRNQHEASNMQFGGTYYLRFQG
jgi:hypothetical protein